MSTDGLRHRKKGWIEGQGGMSPDLHSSEVNQSGLEETNKHLNFTKPDGSRRVHQVRPLSFRSLLLVVACSVVAGVLIGIIMSVTGFVHAIGTYEYPLLSRALGRVFAYFDISIDVEIPERKITSCLPDQPLVVMKEEFMEPELFSKMKECLVEHPQISKNALNPVGFNETRGFVIQFANEKGVTMFRKQDGFNCEGFNPLLPFFDKVHHPEADAFVMNVLVCDKPQDEGKLVVGSHVDDTLAHSKSGVTFLAHAVSVLYISVPSDMKGGALELLGSAPGEDIDGGDTVLQRIDPVENRMVEFRGDSFHQVRGYSTQTKDLRVSLVLEQYRVGPAYQGRVAEYVESVKNGMTML
jgi:hypothetical protein